MKNCHFVELAATFLAVEENMLLPQLLFERNNYYYYYAKLNPSDLQWYCVRVSAPNCSSVFTVVPNEN